MAAQRPTILQIIPKLEAGGAELAVIDMAEAVVKAGGRALVLAEPGRMTPRLKAVGGEAIDFPASTKNPLKLLANARAIARLAHECRRVLLRWSCRVAGLAVWRWS